MWRIASPLCDSELLGHDRMVIQFVFISFSGRTVVGALQQDRRTCPGAEGGRAELFCNSSILTKLNYL